jgi:glycogen synthase
MTVHIEVNGKALCEWRRVNMTNLMRQHGRSLAIWCSCSNCDLNEAMQDAEALRALGIAADVVTGVCPTYAEENVDTHDYSDDY